MDSEYFLSALNIIFRRGSVCLERCPLFKIRILNQTIRFLETE